MERGGRRLEPKEMLKMLIFRGPMLLKTREMVIVLIMLIFWGTFINMEGVRGGGQKLLQTREMLIMSIMLLKKVLKTKEMLITLIFWGTCTNKEGVGERGGV